MEPTGLTIVSYLQGGDYDSSDFGWSSDEEPPPMVTPTKSDEDCDLRAPSWSDALEMIQKKPSLLTSHVFCTTLEQNPPLYVIQQMLEISPKVADVPNQGPTALQIAVKEGASLDVIRAVVEACPFALCVTNPQNALDPLSYARRHRKNETELIELLSRPLTHWVAKGSTRLVVEDGGHDTYYAEKEDRSMIGLATKSSKETSVGLPINDHTESVDRQELNNVKLVCAQVLKGHKKLAKQLKLCQEQLKEASCEKFDPNDVLLALDKQQKHHFRCQLIALDMKERAFNARVQDMEDKCIKRCHDQVHSWKQALDGWKAQTDTKFAEMKVLLDHEVRINSHFRNDFSRWIEAHESETMDANKENGQEVVLMEHDCSDDVGWSPIMFSTNLGETSDRAPLNVATSSSSDESGEENDSDPPILSPPKRSLLHRRRHHPWTPTILKWDRITL